MDSDPVLITGVGKRVGLFLARSFMDAGIPVIGTYRSENSDLEELRELGVVLIQCDFYRQDSVQFLIGCVKQHTVALRAVIHNASDWLPDKAEQGQGVFGKMMRIHAEVPYLINDALWPLLKHVADNEADIIHISDNVTQTGSANNIAYSASKAALENLTLSFAKRLAPKVKVNSIAPALIKFNEGDEREYKERVLKKALLEKEGGYEEVWKAVRWLMQSNYVTGTRIVLNGGRHLKS